MFTRFIVMYFKLGQCLVAVGDDRKVWQLPGATFHWIFPKFDGHTSTCYWNIASLPVFSDHLSLFSLCAKHMLGGNRLKCCWEMMSLPVWWIEVGFTMLWSKFHDDLTKCYRRKKWKEKKKQNGGKSSVVEINIMVDVEVGIIIANVCPTLSCWWC